MKLTPIMATIIALSTTPAMAAEMNPLCQNQIRAALSMLEGGGAYPDENGNYTVAKTDTDYVQISNVKVLSSACLGPAECDDQNPDAFTYGADIGKKGEGLNGRVVVSYHRGNCSIRKITLKD